MKKLKNTKISYKEKFEKRKEYLNKIKKINQVKRMYGTKYTLSPDMKEEKIDDILRSVNKSKQLLIILFYVIILNFYNP